MTTEDVVRLRAMAMKSQTGIVVPAAVLCDLCDLADRAIRMREPYQAMAAAVRARDEAYRGPDVDADASEEKAYQAHLRAVVALWREEGGK